MTKLRRIIEWLHNVFHSVDNLLHSCIKNPVDGEVVWVGNPVYKPPSVINL